MYNAVSNYQVCPFDANHRLPQGIHFIPFYLHLWILCLYSACCIEDPFWVQWSAFISIQRRRPFYCVLISNKLFSNYKFSSNAKRMCYFTAFRCFHVYPCCLKAWSNQKLGSKVVLIVLIYTTRRLYLKINSQ